MMSKYDYPPAIREVIDSPGLDIEALIDGVFLFAALISIVGLLWLMN